MDDRQLLAEYASSGSERAFEEIVRRYADMVYATCLRVLNDRHAAEDAAQAAFLVLARKGRRLAPETVLPGWLHLTARQAALALRQQERRRARRERESADMRERTSNQATWAEVGPRLDAALAALPRAQRETLVLRYLCGRTTEEVARATGASEAAAAKRLTRALARLRARLADHGTALPAAVLGGLLAGNAVRSAPAGLASGMAAAALGKATASGAATSVAEGVMKMMFWTKVKVLAAVVSAAAVLGGTGGVLAVKMAAGEPKAAPKSAPESPDMVPLNAKWPKKKWPSRNPVPYKDDPAVVAKLKALGERTGLMLGKFKVTPADAAKWHSSFKRGPSRRGFCNKLPYAPDRKTAMYCGADHGSPHGLNDVWEYHLGSNTWNLILPPASDKHRYAVTRNAAHRARKQVEKGVDVEKNKAIIKEKEAYMRKWWSKMSVAEGYIQSPNGGPVYPWHTWDGLTYDTRTKRLYWAELSSDNVKAAVQLKYTRDYAKMFGKDVEELVAMIKPGTSMYAYDPVEGRWMRQMGPGPFPNMRGMGGSLHYIPDIDKTVWYCNVGNATGGKDGMWSYDAKTNKWSQLLTKGQIAGQIKNFTAPYEELQMAYSSKHKKLVSVQGRRTFTYDVKANRWSGAAACPGFASDATTVFDYDGGADVFIFVYKDAPGKRGYSDEPWRLAAYDLAKDKWEVVKVRGQNLPQDPKRVPGRNWVGQGFAGYYDPGHNVFVLYCSRDVTTWVYRHKKAGK